MIFNLLAIAFLFAFKNLYRALERLMMGFVGLMLLAFALNLCFARPHLGELLRGFVPRPLATSHDFVLLFGLVGTTFVTTVAFFQSYLVQQKGWRRDDLAAGRVDVRIGSTIMAVITLMIMCTSAAVLRGKQLNGVGDVGVQLRPLFGGWGQLLFCLGLFSAAYSSFIVNSMIGGFMLADGLGIGSHPSQRAPRLLTTVVLLTGMFFSLYAIRTEKPPVAAIVAAQAVTVLASPLLAGTLLWLTNRKDVMGTELQRSCDQRDRWAWLHLATRHGLLSGDRKGLAVYRRGNPMSGPLSDRVIVVIGGTTGLGLSGAQACVEAGAHVVVVGRNSEKVTAAVEQLGNGAEGLTGDATAPATAATAIAKAVGRFGRLDGLYHVAGGSGRRFGDGPLDEISDEGWAATLDLNLTSLFNSNRAAVRQLLAQGTGGSILNMGSVLAHAPAPQYFATHAYAAAKAGIEGLTKAAAAYYAHCRIRFNVLAPALVDTPMAQAPLTMTPSGNMSPRSSPWMAAGSARRPIWTRRSFIFCRINRVL